MFRTLRYSRELPYTCHDRFDFHNHGFIRRSGMENDSAFHCYVQYSGRLILLITPLNVTRLHAS